MRVLILIESRYDGALQGQDCNVALQHLTETFIALKCVYLRNSDCVRRSLLQKCAALRACVSVSHPEGLIETVVLVLVRKSPLLMNGRL